MNDLAQMNERINQWMAQKPQGGGGQNELRLDQGDIAFVKFCASGQDGDRFIKVYRAHSIPVTGKNGNKGFASRYCPIQSDDSDIHECPWCAAGNDDLKERMSMWFAISNILHTQMPKDKQFPQVNFENRFYFNEDVQDFKIWHTSAWRESPWTSIVKLNELYKGLHNFSAQLVRTGTMINTKYSLFAIPNSDPVKPELYEMAKQQCQPIIEILRAQITTPVAANPQAATTVGQVANTVVPFSVPGVSVPGFSPNGFPTQQPVVNPPTGTAEAMMPTNAGAPIPGAVAVEENQPSIPTEEEDSRRPLKGMF